MAGGGVGHANGGGRGAAVTFASGSSILRRKVPTPWMMRSWHSGYLRSRFFIARIASALT